MAVTKADKAIFWMLLLSAAIMLAAVHSAADTAAVTAVIEIDGREYGRYNLKEKTKQILAIETNFGYNKIVIENGALRVCESSCPDKLEIQAGTVLKAGQILVCLPNRMVIRLVGRGDVDCVAY